MLDYMHKCDKNQEKKYGIKKKIILYRGRMKKAGFGSERWELIFVPYFSEFKRIFVWSRILEKKTKSVMIIKPAWKAFRSKEDDSTCN